jgi:hypothetical protein
MRRALGAPSSRRTKSLFVRRCSCRSRRPKPMGERASLRSAWASPSHAASFGAGKPRAGHGGGRFVTKQRREAWHRTVGEAGRSDADAFRRLCSDPARIRQMRFAEHLRGCRLDRPPCGGWTHPRKSEDKQAASFHLLHELGGPRELDGGTVGLDPSRACIRTPLFTMYDHGWPPLPMTRPKSLSGAEVVPCPFAVMELRVPSRRRGAPVSAVSRRAASLRRGRGRPPWGF